MGKKRHALLDESDLDSSSDGSSDHERFEDRDLEAEHELFNDPYQSKRSKKRRTNGKAEALYGVFAEDHTEDIRKPQKINKRLHKPQIFVPSTSSNAREQSSSKEVEDQENIENQDPSSSDDDSDASGSEADDHTDDSLGEGTSEKEPADPVEPPPQPTTARMGLGARSGLGSSNLKPAASNDDFRAMLGSGSMSNSFQRAGLGSKPLPEETTTPYTDPPPEPPTDSNTPVPPRRSFLGAQVTEEPIVVKKPLSKAEQQHFAKLATSKNSSMGLKMLEKMGWKSGTGLGAKGEGIVTPLESKLRPKGMGLSYEGFEERTKQAKEEDRRNGKIVEDEAEPGSQKKVSGSQKKVKPEREAWKSKPKSAKKGKVIHKTYEEIISDLAETSGNVGVDSGLGEIIDLTGRKLPSLSTTLSHHSRGPTEEAKDQRLPELMHNLGLICDMAKGNLINLAKEGNAIKQKQDQLVKDQAKSEELIKIKRQKLENMRRIVTISAKTKETYLDILNIINHETKGEEICSMLDRFDESFNQLLQFFQDDRRSEYDSLKLDEIVVCALAPILRRVWQDWDTLRQPYLSVAELKRFKKCFRLEDRAGSSTTTTREGWDDPHASHSGPPRLNDESRKMSAYESLIWNDWVPKIRSSVNSWCPTECEPMIELYVKWKPLLPAFVHDNLLDQLIVPKLLSFIRDWDFRQDRAQAGSTTLPLHLSVFPWLQHLGAYRNELLLQEVKIKLAAWLKAQNFEPTETGEREKGILQDLLIWKQDVFKRKEWDKLVLKSLVPNLAAYLRSQLIINPKQQDLKAFHVLLHWTQLTTHEEVLDQLFSQFFSKWLDTLWIWLVAGTGAFEQIGQWYNWWKSIFPDHLAHQIQAVGIGFARGLELMNQARSLTSLNMDLKTKLERPDLVARPLTSAIPKSKSKTKPKPKPKSARLAAEVTFESIVEEEATKRDLLMIPLGKSLDSNGMSLYRVSRAYQSTTKKNMGVVIYIEDDVVFVKTTSAESDEDWEPMAVDEMLEKALALSGVN